MENWKTILRTGDISLLISPNIHININIIFIFKQKKYSSKKLDVKHHICHTYIKILFCPFDSVSFKPLRIAFISPSLN